MTEVCVGRSLSREERRRGFVLDLQTNREQIDQGFTPSIANASNLRGKEQGDQARLEATQSAGYLFRLLPDPHVQKRGQLRSLASEARADTLLRFREAVGTLRLVMVAGLPRS